MVGNLGKSYPVAILLKNINVSLKQKNAAMNRAEKNTQNITKLGQIKLLARIFTAYYSFISRVIKKLVTSSRAEMKNPLEKLSIAFSNTTYLNIIWRFSLFMPL